MATTRFNLNDIDAEPSDEALASLMQAVSDEARRREQLSREQMMNRLRQAIKELHKKDAAA